MQIYELFAYLGAKTNIIPIFYNYTIPEKPL